MTQSINKAIVTGASGFLGTALCAELSRRGVRVIAVVRAASDAAYISTLPGLRVVRCDMADYAQLPDMIADRDVDVFFHLAWKGVTGRDKIDKRVQMENIAGTCRAVDACADIGCERFVISSSFTERIASAMMADDVEPAHGGALLYPSAKIAANYMARAACAERSLQYFCGVVANMFGRAGESDSFAEYGLINSSISRIVDDRRCSFSSGDQMYDFISIDDAACALCAVAEHGKPYKSYSIGSGEPRPLKEFLLAMGEAVGAPDKIGLGELDAPMAYDAVGSFDDSALARDTGFVPAVDLKTGITRTYGWIKGMKDC